MNKNILEVREKLHMRKDNLVYFVTEEGMPIDTGAQELKYLNKIPVKLKHVYVGVPKIIEINKRHHILLPIRGEHPLTLSQTKESIKTVLENLKDNIRKLELNSISIAKSRSIDCLEWHEVERMIREIFYREKVKIILCEGLISTPPEQERIKILKKCMDQPFQNIKELTKLINESE